MYDVESRFTVKSLKAVCSALNLPISGTKGLLQQRLRTTFDSIATRQDKERFGIGKAAVEAERGSPYGQPRQQRCAFSKPSIDHSRPNAYYPAPTPHTPARTNTWGMSPLYQNIQLRISCCNKLLMLSCLQENALL